jgi:hypothetical protein
VEYRFCPLCGAYLEKDYVDENALPKCPLGHFTLYPALVAIPGEARHARKSSLGHKKTESASYIPSAVTKFTR